MKIGDIQVLKAKYCLEIKQPARKLIFKTAVGPRVKDECSRYRAAPRLGRKGEERSRHSVTHSVYTAPPAVRSIKRNEN